jgi:hypothetical protein
MRTQTSLIKTQHVTQGVDFATAFPCSTIWPSLRVLARCTPQDKFILVKGLKQLRSEMEQDTSYGQQTAMTNKSNSRPIGSIDSNNSAGQKDSGYVSSTISQFQFGAMVTPPHREVLAMTGELVDLAAIHSNVFHSSRMWLTMHCMTCCLCFGCSIAVGHHTHTMPGVFVFTVLQSSCISLCMPNFLPLFPNILCCDPLALHDVIAAVGLALNPVSNSIHKLPFIASTYAQVMVPMMLQHYVQPMLGLPWPAGPASPR